MKINDGLVSIYLDFFFRKTNTHLDPFVIEKMLCISDDSSHLNTAVESLYVHLIFE